MGKVRINTIGDESLEKKQKAKAEKRQETKSTSVKTMADKEISKSHSDKVGETSQVTGSAKEVLETSAPKSAEKTKKQSPASGVARSKKYQVSVKKVEKNKMYSLVDALKLLEETHLAKFDETVELHVNTHETGVTGSITLPHGTGKEVRVAVLQPSKDEKGANDLLKDIAAGTLNFDVLIATPDAMPKLAKVARILGPRGLMPNPKNGTITTKPEEAAKKYAAGQFSFKTESKAPVIHLRVGKLSFGADKLSENITFALKAVQSKNIKLVTLKSTMSPGIKIQVV